MSRLTAQQYTNYFTTQAKIAFQPDVLSSIETFNKGQRNRETKFLAAESATFEVTGNLATELTHFDPVEIKNKIQKHYQDPSAMDDISYLIGTIAHHEKRETKSATAWRIRRWLRDLRRLSSGAYGDTYKANLKTIKDAFVLKEPKDLQSDMLHEYFIGRHTNKLRELLPNFAYVYAAFSCAPVTNESRDHIKQWCTDTDTSVLYLAYENIAPASQMSKYNEKCSRDEWLNLYVQTLYSIMLAHAEIDFTHFDLHTNNLLVRKVDPTSLVYYDENGELVYIKTNTIATIIDYGKSHIFVDDHAYGSAHPSGLQIFEMYNRSYPITDLFKLLISSAVDTHKKNKVVYSAAMDILKYFTSEPEKLLDQAYEMYAYWPYSDELERTFTLQGLAQHIKKSFSLPFLTKTPTTKKIFGCRFGTDICEPTLAKYEPMKSIFDYYDLVAQTPKLKSRYMRMLDFNVAIVEAKALFTELINEFNVSVEIPLSFYSVLTPNMLINKTITANAKGSVAALLDMFDACYLIGLLAPIFLSVLQDFGKGETATAKSIKKLTEDVEKQRGFIVEGIESYKETAREVRSILSDPGVASSIEGYPTVEWWTVGPEAVAHLKFD